LTLSANEKTKLTHNLQEILDYLAWIGVGIVRPSPHGALFYDCWRRTAGGGKGSCYRNNDKGVLRCFWDFVFLR